MTEHFRSSVYTKS